MCPAVLGAQDSSSPLYFRQGLGPPGPRRCPRPSVEELPATPASSSEVHSVSSGHSVGPQGSSWVLCGGSTGRALGRDPQPTPSHQPGRTHPGPQADGSWALGSHIPERSYTDRRGSSWGRDSSAAPGWTDSRRRLARQTGGRLSVRLGEQHLNPKRISLSAEGPQWVPQKQLPTSLP